MTDASPGTPQILLAHHLKALKLPTFLREHDRLARQCASDGVDQHCAGQNHCREAVQHPAGDQKRSTSAPPGKPRLIP